MAERKKPGDHSLLPATIGTGRLSRISERGSTTLVDQFTNTFLAMNGLPRSYDAHIKVRPAITALLREIQRIKEEGSYDSVEFIGSSILNRRMTQITNTRRILAELQKDQSGIGRDLSQIESGQKRGRLALSTGDLSRAGGELGKTATTLLLPAIDHIGTEVELREAQFKKLVALATKKTQQLVTVPSGEKPSLVEQAQLVRSMLLSEITFDRFSPALTIPELAPAKEYITNVKNVPEVYGTVKRLCLEAGLPYDQSKNYVLDLVDQIKGVLTNIDFSASPNNRTVDYIYRTVKPHISVVNPFEQLPITAQEVKAQAGAIINEGNSVTVTVDHDDFMVLKPDLMETLYLQTRYRDPKQAERMRSAIDGLTALMNPDVSTKRNILGSQISTSERRIASIHSKFDHEVEKLVAGGIPEDMVLGSETLWQTEQEAKRLLILEKMDVDALARTITINHYHAVRLLPEYMTGRPLRPQDRETMYYLLEHSHRLGNALTTFRKGITRRMDIAKSYTLNGKGIPIGAKETEVKNAFNRALEVTQLTGITGRSEMWRSWVRMIVAKYPDLDSIEVLEKLKSDLQPYARRFAHQDGDDIYTAIINAYYRRTFSAEKNEDNGQFTGPKNVKNRIDRQLEMMDYPFVATKFLSTRIAKLSPTIHVDQYMNNFMEYSGFVPPNYRERTYNPNMKKEEKERLEMLREDYRIHFNPLGEGKHWTKHRFNTQLFTLANIGKIATAQYHVRSFVTNRDEIYGWLNKQIRALDADQGKTGKKVFKRPPFTELLKKSEDLIFSYNALATQSSTFASLDNSLISALVEFGFAKPVNDQTGVAEK